MHVQTGFEQDDYDLQTAILLYGSKGSGGWSRSEWNRNGWSRGAHGQRPQTIAVVHGVVRDREGGCVLGAGRPASREAVVALSEALLGARAPQLLPSRTLAVSEDAVLWYVPKGQRRLYFRTQSERLNGLSGIPLPHPGLVFRAERAGGKKSLRVWAFRRRGRPAADTVLYTAPFLNVFAGGSVCLGSTRVPATSGPADAGAWTDAFFASAFTHGQRDFLVGMPGYAGTLSACADDPSLGFPLHRLKRAGLRLRDVVAEM